MKIKGTSTLYKDGEAVMEWVKTTADQEEQERIFREGLAAMSEKMPRVAKTTKPTGAKKELLNLYTITDFHLGMLAWHKEGGADWDLKIAEETLIGCFTEMLSGAPQAGEAIVCQLGDFLHSDFPALSPLTPMSGHTLDADGRASKVIRIAIRLLRTVVDMALAKHDTVRVIMAEGNHDITSSIWLRHTFAALYENEPRVTIDTSELPYYCYQFGNTMLAFHHGHMKKMPSLTSVFAAEFAPIWGATKWRYGHCGHFHHTAVKEDAGMTITQHETLAARDAYSSRGAYYGGRKAESTTYHKDHGKVGATFVTPEMIA
ncbi:winged helix-turn-helix domain-containing protein [bacterium]|nr:winged helix-turn-helix domain-containing protein [bacterium]